MSGDTQHNLQVRGGDVDERIIDFIVYLSGCECVPATEAAAHFNVSTRTVRTYVQQANEVLGDTASISSSRLGYRLEVRDEHALQVMLNPFASAGELPVTRENRVAYLLNDLLSRSGWITIEELAKMLFVTARTVSSDLRAVEETLAHYDLQLEKKPRYGIRVVGSELNRRLCLANNAVAQVTGSAAGDKERVDIIGACLNEVLADQGISVNSLAYQNLVIHIVIALIRIEQGCYVPMPMEQYEKIASGSEYQAAGAIARGIETKLGVELPREEIAYIAIHLLGKRTLSLQTVATDQAPTDASDGQSEDSLIISDEVWGVVSRMVGAVRDTFHFDFRDDLELRMNLARHIVPLSVRLRYHLSMDNPLLHDIKRRFPLGYAMACDCAGILEDAYGTKPSDNELGYIAMAFALAVERKKTDAPKKNILVVCASGHGSARLLEHRYQQEFGPYLNRVITCDAQEVSRMDFSHIDYVFTTVPLPCAVPVPVREVKYFLDDSDIRNVRRILSDSAEPSAALSCFRRGLFFPHLACVSKREALEFLCGSVEQAGLVPAGFLDLVQQREDVVPTTFGNNVAMPHPMQPVSDKTSVAVGLLDRPLVWDEAGTTVQAVFLISFSREGGRELDAFFSGLADLFMDERAIKALVRDQDWDTLVRELRATLPSS